MVMSGIGCFSHIEVNTEIMVSRKKESGGEIGFGGHDATPSLIQ